MADENYGMTEERYSEEYREYSVREFERARPADPVKTKVSIKAWSADGESRWISISPERYERIREILGE